MGLGAGHGQGKGQGRGEDTCTNIAVGGVVAIVFTVLMCCFGVPLIIAGVVFVLVNMPGSPGHSSGIGMLAGACFLTVGGIILIILICTGVFNKKRPQQATSAVVVVNQSQLVTQQAPATQQQCYPTPQQSYPTPQQGYPPPQPGYPPPQPGYPPTQPGYPPTQPGYPASQADPPPPYSSIEQHPAPSAPQKQ